MNELDKIRRRNNGWRYSNYGYYRYELEKQKSAKNFQMNGVSTGINMEKWFISGLNEIKAFLKKIEFSEYD